MRKIISSILSFLILIVLLFNGSKSAFADNALFLNPSFSTDLSSWTVGLVPTDISSLQVWLKADSISGINDGAAVSSWSDLSSNNFNATQSTGNLQPVYKTNIINGQPVVRFNGSNYLQLISSSLGMGNNTQGLSIIAVSDSQSTSTTQRIFNLTTATGTDRATLGLTNTGSLTALGRRLDSDSAQTVSGGSYSANTFSINDAVFDYNNTQLNVYKNSTSVGSSSSFQTSGSTSSTNSKNINLGSNGTNGLNGDIAELAVFNSTLSTADRQNIEAYLGNKYNITNSSSPITPTRNTTTTYNHTNASAKVITTTLANFTQLINVGDSGSYNLSVYAYTNGNAVTASDLQLYANGSAVTTTFTSFGSGWYQLTAIVTGSPNLTDYGVQIQANKTVYLDNFSLNSINSDAGDSSGAPDPNFPSGWSARITAGPNFKGITQFVSDPTIKGVSALLMNNVSKDDLSLEFAQSLFNNLYSVGDTILTSPLNQNYLPISNFYSISAISAFNGYPELRTLLPFTLLLSFDKTKTLGEDIQNAVIITYDENSQTWKELNTPSVVNEKNSTVANVTTDFGFYAVAIHKPIQETSTISKNTSTKAMLNTSKISSSVKGVKTFKTNPPCHFLCFANMYLVASSHMYLPF